MPICPAGHQTAQTDFCDTCGLPVPGGQQHHPGPVTVLTSLSAEDVAAVGFTGTPEEAAQRLARLAAASGVAKASACPPISSRTSCAVSTSLAPCLISLWQPRATGE